MSSKLLGKIKKTLMLNLREHERWLPSNQMTERLGASRSEANLRTTQDI